jgi:phosphoglycolate phosphatase-like HAD superfamily hydrolase
VGHLFLFDIDFTLIRSRGAGSSAMNATLHHLLGVENAFAGVDFSGRTDRAIIRDALRNHGRELPEEDYEAFLGEFQAHYIPALERELAARGGAVLPGVRETLDAVAALPDVRVGIATGNFRRAADVKLRFFELDGYFADGGFADDAEDRGVLVGHAIERLGGAAGGDYRVFVIGDTSHDIMAARANNAVAVGVATGGTSPELLAAAGAHHVFNDLSDPAFVLRLLLGEAGDARPK